MGEGPQKVVLNLGCGINKLPQALNVDAYGEPDVKWDLNQTPWPFEDNRFVHIQAYHVFEHLRNWWGAFEECSRVLAPYGTMELRMPHESSQTALCYRDHLNVFSPISFHGIEGSGCGNNAWAKEVKNSLPIKMIDTKLVPFNSYQWMMRWCPWLLSFCATHLRNFIWEQRYYFQSTKPIGGIDGR